MLALLLSAVLMAAAQTDETLDVQRGARLEVHNFAGEVIVRTWDRDAIRVQASHSDRERVSVQATDQRVLVRTSSRLGAPRSIDFAITVPRWIRVQINGTYLDVRVEGTQGEVVAENVRGIMHVTGGAGYVSLKSVEGQVTLQKASGKISVSSVNEGVRVVESSGDISAETVNGPIVLENLSAGSVDAATVNGRIAFSGTIGAGPYRFSTHNGQVVIAIPENSHVTIVGRTYQGRFRSAFAAQPVEAPGSSTRRTLTLGDGRARMEAESFSGSVTVQPIGARPGG